MVFHHIQKDYLTLEEVAAACDVGLEDLRYFGEEGKLEICTRHIPVKVAIENILDKEPYTNDPKLGREILQCLEEPQELHPTDIYQVFANRPGKTVIRRLKTRPVMSLVKVIDPPIEIGFDDLVIKREEKERFAFTYLKKSASFQNPLVIISPDFRNFMLYNHEYFFGEKQSKVIKYLHQKYIEGDPWVHSKKLLDIADAHSWRLHNLFSHSKEWRNVIKSSKNGYYMINLPSDKKSPAKRSESDGQPDLFDFMHK